MASGRIKGVTIKIGGDVTELNKALSDVDKALLKTNTALKDTNKLLKLDPKNTELLAQKQKLLKDAIGKTKDRLTELKKAQSQVQEGSAEWDALQREIIDTEKKLEGLEKEYKDFGSVAVQQIKAVGRELQEAGKKIQDFGQKLAPVSAAAAAFGGALLKMGYDAVTGADDLNTLAKQTGFTTEEIQKMKYASDLIDVSFEDVTGALTKMKKNMTGHADTWKKLGVSVTNADGSMRDATDVFYDAISALSKVENGTERDQLAMDLFGKSADSLAGIIDDGGAALQEYGNQAQDMGLIIEQDVLDTLNETNDTIDKLKANVSATMGAVGADVAQTLAPALEVIAEKVEIVTAKIRELTPEQTAIILAITGILAILSPLIILIGGLVASIGAIITLGAPVAAAIGLITAALAGIPITIKGVKTAIDLLVKAWNYTKDACKQMKDGLINDWNAIKTGIAEKIEGAKTAVSNTFNNIKSTVTSTADNIKNTVTTKFNAVKTAMTQPIETAKTSITNAINKIKNIVNNAKLSLPKIKLPHFKINGGQVPWGIGGVGHAPSISIDWYKRAYDDPVLFTKPTVLPTVNGLKGFGDGAGAEVVMGLKKLQSLAGNITNNIVVNAAPGMNVNDLAEAVADEIQFRMQQERAVYA